MKKFVQCISLLIAISCLYCSLGNAQTFTEITDPGNPVVNDQFESGGGAWIDVNNDGYLDLFVANGNLSNQNNSFYLNNTNGTFTKVTTGAIVTDGGSSIGSTWGDFNSDGKIDLFVTNRANFGNFLYLGTGDTVFTKVTTGGPVTDIANSNSSSWVDLDRDGNLDLYTINFQGNDFYYHNNGTPVFDFTRIDTLLQVGDGANFSISGSWSDYNNDQLPDLFVGNAGTQSDYLYRNDDNNVFFRFTHADGSASVGNSWGDYDNDGNPDLFVANTLGQNNILYHNSGFPSYTLDPVTSGIIVNDGGSSVGSAWGDYDNDGDLDLFVGNDGGNNFLYENDGPPNYTFTKITSGSIVNDGGNSFGAVWGDYDNDGQIDLFVANRLNQKNFLYHNDGNNNHWIDIKCGGIVSNKTAIGTKLRLKATINGVARWQMREVQAQTGYNSQNLNVHFGLGDATVIDSIIIEWPLGLDEYYTNVQVDQFISFVEETPPAPVLLSATVRDSAITLRWHRSPIGNFDHYNIFADTAQNPIVSVGSVFTQNDTDFTITGLDNYREYFFRVTVVNTESISSVFSNELSSTPLPVIDAEIPVDAKWNIVSLPVRVVDSLKTVLFPTATSSAFSFSSGAGYQSRDTLHNHIGYWIKFSGAQSIPVTGFSIDNDMIPVTAGWNLIGSITQPVSVQSITSNPPGLVTGNFFGYDQGYFSTDTITPGKGYWVKVNQEGSLILSSGSLTRSASHIRIIPTSELPPSPPFEVSIPGRDIPKTFSVEQNYPNPFNPATVISYSLPVTSYVTLKIFDILGREVATLVDGLQQAGYKSIGFTAGNLTSGIYFYRLQTDTFTEIDKMLLMK